MAGFIVEPRLRPCKITIRTYDKPRDGRYMTETKKKALFHCWNHKSEILAPSLLKGGHTGGVVSYTVALVELEDGTIREVLATDIQFCDSVFPEYAFPEECKS